MVQTFSHKEASGPNWHGRLRYTSGFHLLHPSSRDTYYLHTTPAIILPNKEPFTSSGKSLVRYDLCKSADKHRFNPQFNTGTRHCQAQEEFVPELVSANHLEPFLDGDYNGKTPPMHESLPKLTPTGFFQAGRTTTTTLHPFPRVHSQFSLPHHLTTNHPVKHGQSTSPSMLVITRLDNPPAYFLLVFLFPT
jgi:hypothetical protein